MIARHTAHASAVSAYRARSTSVLAWTSYCLSVGMRGLAAAFDVQRATRNPSDAVSVAVTILADLLRIYVDNWEPEATMGPPHY